MKALVIALPLALALSACTTTPAGPPYPASLAGTVWTVESVGNRPTGGGERFTLRFDRDRMSGKFGCNSVSGPYRYDGDTFTAGDLAMTRMACPDMSFEELATGIMRAPLVARAEGDRLTLSNPPSHIVLRRQY